MFPVIVCAEPDELKYFLRDFDLEKEEVIGFTRMFWGEYQGIKIGLACLGVGKVNAASGTVIVAHRMRPDAMFMIGASGALSPDVVMGDIIIGTELIDRDVGYLTKKGHIPGGAWLYDKKRPYYPYLVRGILPDERLLEVAKDVAADAKESLVSFGPRKAKIFFAPIVTGEQFVADLDAKSRFYQRYSAFAGEMEGSGFAQTAYALGLPFLVVRGISDKADNTVDLKDPVVYSDTASLEHTLQEPLEGDPMKNASQAAESLHSVFQKASFNAASLVWNIVTALGFNPEF